MKILKFLLLAVFFLVVVLRAGSVHAALTGFNSDCLDAKVTAEDGHTAKLTFPVPPKSLLPQPAVQTWIFVCITTPDGKKCTSGDVKIDDDVFGKHADLDAINNMTSFTTKVVGGEKNNRNPDKTTNDAANPQFVNEILWHDIYNPGVEHTWSWVQKPIPIDNAGAGAGNLGSQQQATFDFLHKTADSSKCAKISWDPKGYVFDAKTLYPVKGVSIMISKGVGGIYTDIPNGLGMTNPDSSHELDGQYSFYTPDGTYKLRIVSSNASIADLRALSIQEQARISSLFALTNPTASTLYQVNNEIRETAGKIAISHMPILLTNPGDLMLIKTLSIIQRKEERGNGGDLELTGFLSHPKSLIKLTISYIDKDNKTYIDTRTETANEIGEYKVTIPQTKTITTTTGQVVNTTMSNYEARFSLNPQFYPGTLSQANSNNPSGLMTQLINKINSLFVRVVHAASSDLSFAGKPIPSYLEGIAYDSKGIVIPKAIVGIYPVFSNNPMYLTIADENGRYKIGSQHIPQFEYFLRYKKATGEVIQVDTTTFIKQNSKLISEEGIKLFEEKQTTLAEDKKVQDFFTNTKTTLDLKPTIGGQKNNTNNKYVPSGSNGSSSNSTQGGGIMSAGTQGIVMIIVVIMVLIMIGVGAFIMMKSKQQLPPQY